MMSFSALLALVCLSERENLVFITNCMCKSCSLRQCREMLNSVCRSMAAQYIDVNSNIYNSGMIV